MAKTLTANSRLTILVPVYNEEKTILDVLKKVTSLPIESYEVIVVDDASKDSSPKIVKQFASTFEGEGVTLKVIRHGKNRGKGAGIKTGIEHAAGEYFVVQDADFEYDPKEITTLLAAAHEGSHSVVYGSRFIGSIKNMPKPNYLANKFYNFLIRRLYPTKITDMHTCYKMVRTDIIRNLQMQSEGFGYATELVSKILKKGIPIHEVPISFVGRNKKQGKKIGVSDGVECIYMIFKYRLGRSA